MGGNACDTTRVILLLGLISCAASTSLDSFPEARIIHMAAKEGDVEKVKAELKTDPANALARTVANITALHLGAAQERRRGVSNHHVVPEGFQRWRKVEGLPHA